MMKHATYLSLWEPSFLSLSGRCIALFFIQTVSINYYIHRYPLFLITSPHFIQTKDGSYRTLTPEHRLNSHAYALGGAREILLHT